MTGFLADESAPINSFTAFSAQGWVYFQHVKRSARHFWPCLLISSQNCIMDLQLRVALITSPVPCFFSWSNLFIFVCLKSFLFPQSPPAFHPFWPYEIFRNNLGKLRLYQKSLSGMAFAIKENRIYLTGANQRKRPEASFWPKSWFSSMAAE